MDMRRGALTVLPKENNDQKYIDIIIDSKGYNTKDFAVYEIQRIRIRAIKNTSNKCKITSEEKQIYNEYSKWINDFCNGIPDKENEAFEQKGPLFLPKQCERKRLKQKITDLYNAINDCCHSTHEEFIDTSKNRPILPKKRYDAFLKNDEEYMFEPHCYDSFFERKDFSYCQKLSYNSINLANINKNWFLAKGLLSLSFTNMNIFKLPGACIDFARNIHKLECLSILELNQCKIREIPYYIYYELPKWLTCISLENNYIQKISPLISKITFLRKLSLENNRNLNEDGIPWNSLPESVEILELGKTSMTKIPKEAKRLKNLRILGIEIPGLKEIECDKMIKDMYTLSLSNSKFLTNHKAERVTSVTLKNVGLSNLDEILLPPHIQELKLSINNITSWDISWERYKYLSVIDLSHNMLTWIPWELLPSTLELMDFSNNLLEGVGTLKNLRNLRNLFLQHNMISEIVETEVYIGNIDIVNLSHNHLMELPFGFESMWNPKNLDLSYNRFANTDPDIDLFFWGCLPGAIHLDISGNAIEELPCHLAGKAFYLKAIGCKLRYICPQIYNIHFEHNCKEMIHINVAKNDDLQTLSFIPHTIHPVAGANEKPCDAHLHFDDYELQYTISRYDNEFVERSVIVTNNPKLRSTQRTGRLIQYNFNEVEENEFEKKCICRCCAYCKRSEARKYETIMIEQTMMMGCVLALVNDEECHSEKVFDSPGWQAGKWKSLIRTRLCQGCIQKLKDKTDEANKSFVKPEKVPKKPKLQAPAIAEANDVEMVANNLFTTSSDRALITATNDVEMIAPQPPPLPELAWIQYIVDNPHTYAESISLIYCYPSVEYLQGICTHHGLFFHGYVFTNYNEFYGSNIFNSRNLLTAKMVPDGNSGYQGLSYLLTGTVASSAKIKALICHHISSGFLSQNFYTIYQQQFQTPELSYKECELYAVAHLFQLNILIFNYKNDGKWFIINESWLDREDRYTVFLPQRPSILLSKDQSGNYNAVLATKENMVFA